MGVPQKNLIRHNQKSRLGTPQKFSFVMAPSGKVKEISKPITTFEVPQGYKEKYSGHS